MYTCELISLKVNIYFVFGHYFTVYRDPDSGGFAFSLKAGFGFSYFKLDPDQHSLTRLNPDPDV
jgi:hypothetical protein